jgi:hypothetical protein
MDRYSLTVLSPFQIIEVKEFTEVPSIAFDSPRQLIGPVIA